MITKKDIPFDLLQTIEPIVQVNLDLVKLIKDDVTFYNFVETDQNSSNYFKIYIDGAKKISNFAGGNFVVEWKPGATTRVKSSLSQLDIKKLGVAFQDWLILLRKINDTPSVHDDNFVNKYSNYYFNEFKLVDDDANSSPFDPNEQDFIEGYLHSLASAIEQSDDTLTEEAMQELLNDIREIEITLPSSTKNQVLKGITKVFGKLYKASKVLAKEIVVEAKKHLIKGLIDQVI